MAVWSGEGGRVGSVGVFVNRSPVDRLPVGDLFAVDLFAAGLLALQPLGQLGPGCARIRKAHQRFSSLISVVRCISGIGR